MERGFGVDPAFADPLVEAFRYLSLDVVMRSDEIKLVTEKSRSNGSSSSGYVTGLRGRLTDSCSVTRHTDGGVITRTLPRGDSWILRWRYDPIKGSHVVLTMGDYSPWNCDFRAPRNPPEALHFRYQTAVAEFTSVIESRGHNPYFSDARVLANWFWERYSRVAPPPLLLPEKQEPRSTIAEVPLEQLLPRYSAPAQYPWSPTDLYDAQNAARAAHIPPDFYATQHNQHNLKDNTPTNYHPAQQIALQPQIMPDIRAYHMEEKALATVSVRSTGEDGKGKRWSRGWLKIKLK